MITLTAAGQKTMIPRSADVANSLIASRRALQVAPWKIVLTYSCAALVWITVTNLVIESLTLPDWAYSMRTLVFVAFTTVSMWFFTRRLTRNVISSQALIGEAERGYRALFEVHPAPMWLYDLRSRLIVMANQMAVSTYGYGEEQFAELDVIDLYAPEERQRLRQRAESAGLHCEDLTGIRKHVCRNGRILDVDVLCHTCLFNGQDYGLVMAQDITAHFTIEKKLRQSLKQLELAQQIAMLGYWEYDPESGRIVCSPEIHSVLGFDRDLGELPRERYLQAVHSVDREDLLQYQRQALRRGQHTHRYRVVRPNGEVRCIFERVQVTREPGQQKRTLFGAAMDITELVLAERQLARQQRLYERMVESLPVGVLVIREGRIQYSNTAARSMLGGTLQESLEFAQCIHPAHRARELDRLHALEQRLIDEQPLRPVKMLRLDGSAFDAEIAEILLENDGKLDVQLLVRDISQAQRMRQELLEANSRLQHLSQRLIEVQETERRQLARDLHDDIGQLLTGLKLHLQRLSRIRDGDPETRDMVTTLVQNVDEALGKVRSLSLALHPLQLETLGLEAAVRWHLRHFLAATPTTWELQVDGDLDRLPTDKAVAAFRIIQEAVNNVARHAAASHLRILLATDQDGLHVEVLDDGRGFNLGKAIQGAQSLGLTSMQERVAALDGQLKVASIPGVGTRVTARLPAPCGERRQGAQHS